jgi:tetratricopeptide (TPR) repeat protein
MISDTRVEEYGRRLERPQIAARLLEFLIELLYPDTDEASPEIIRLKDVERRYPLTKLQPNGPARQALAQSRRINRSPHQHRQLGLSEYYAGLIFLYYNDDYHRALTQFAEARRQWSFVNETLAVCLTHYGQGLVHYHDGDYEAALRQYTIVERQLQRMHFSNNQDRLLQHLRHYLDEDKAVLLERMWPPEAEPEPEPEPEPAPEAARPRTAAATEPPYVPGDGATPGPRNEQEAGQAALPVDQMNAPTPMPGHQMRGQRYAWYEVVEQDDHYFDDVARGSWLLVDKEQKLDAGPGARVIVGDHTVYGGVGVRAFGKNGEVGQRIRMHCLGKFVEPIEYGSFLNDPDSGEVTLQVANEQFITVQKDKIVGVVIGIWQQVFFSQ